MKKGKEKCNRNNLILVLMIICVLLSLTILGIVAYGKFIKDDCNTCETASCWNK